ncbi:MAG: S41 family peptidase [Candidatus Promineifilaceae bacterium]|nr:S41 family peptidase [Candidatus Promineifilaceae bacterium]
MKRSFAAAVVFSVYTFVILAAGFWMGRTGWPLVELGVPVAVAPPEAEEQFAPFWEVWNLVNARYVNQPLDPDTLTEGAINGMLNTLDDPHTRYLPPAQEEAARENMEGEFSGIGVLVEMVDDQITIVSPFEGSPAEAAGLNPGDVLLEADGVSLEDASLSDAADLIRGPAGTTVHLVVSRNGEIFEVDVERDVIRIPSVRGEMLEANIAYVRLNRFANLTAEEMEETLAGLMAQNPDGLILDVRNNPGGGLQPAITVADQFLPEGVILVERFGGGREELYESTDEGMAENIPMVVLMNEGSASAAEVLAGALRDRERATLIGTTTFGKGTVQTWHPLSNGGGVRITVARWLTPNGVWLHEDGLEPDIRVAPLDAEEAQAHPLAPSDDEAAEDAQLRAAIEFLKE